MQDKSVIIHGVTVDGKKLRPSDWIERICSSMSAFEERQCQSSLAKNIQVCIVDGEKCLIFARNLENLNPRAYEFVMSFANINKLKVMEDRRHGDRALGE